MAIFYQRPLSVIVTIGVIGSAPATTARVIFVAVLVTDLATRLAASEIVLTAATCSQISSDLPILTALGETLIQISTDDTLVQLGAANVLHAVQRVLVVVVFDEAEPAWSLLVAVETHDKSLYFTTSEPHMSESTPVSKNSDLLRKKLVDLLLGGVE